MPDREREILDAILNEVCSEGFLAHVKRKRKGNLRNRVLGKKLGFLPGFST